MSTSDPKLVFDMLNNDEAFKNMVLYILYYHHHKVIGYLDALRIYHERLNAGMMVLFELHKMFSAKYSLTSLYLQCLEEDMVCTSGVIDMLGLLGYLIYQQLNDYYRKFSITKMKF